MIPQQRRSFILLALLVSLVSGCAWIEGRETGGQYMDDASISTRIRTAVITDPNLKLSQIDVETMQGTVQLSGFVDNAEAKRRAEDLARRESGVKAVRNNLVLRSSSQNPR